MRTLILITVLSASSLIAQTTGQVGINDYTITCSGCATGSTACGPPAAGFGGLSGSTSSTSLTFDPTSGGVLTFGVTCAPLSFVQIYVNTVPCIPCFVPLVPETFYTIPYSACGATTNQSVDLDLSDPLFPLLNGLADGGGNFMPAVQLPPISFSCFSFCTQALIVDPAASSGFLVTQAYDVTLL